MNRFLLVWNIVLSMFVVAVMLFGCSSGNTAQINYLSSQVEANKAAIAQLQATVTQNSQAIQSQSAQVQSGLQTLSTQLQQYVQQYVSQALGK